MVIELMRENSDLDPGERERSVVVKVIGPNGPVEQEIKIAHMLAESAPLDALSLHCNGCPANLREIAFGCGGAIHYPLMEETEEWLVSRLPDDLGAPAGKLLLHAIRDMGYDGARVDAARLRKEIYAADKPIARKWGSFFSRKTRITSSQVIHMLAGTGNLSPLHSRLVCWFLGFLDEEMKPEHNSENKVAETDIQGVAEFKMFLLAAAFAGANDLILFVDA